jgi:hypothetical protein
MTFQKTSQLNTFEPVFGSKKIGQIVVVPSGRLDKVSPLLVPVGSSSAMVMVEIYSVSGGIPDTLLASDSIPLSDITIKGYVNFQVAASLSPNAQAAILLSVPDGDENNCVEWVYETTQGGLGLLTSLDNGVTWQSDSTRIFSYVAFSLKDDAVDPVNQTALIGPGTLLPISDAAAYWQTLPPSDFWQTDVTVGDTVAINFGNFVVTIVVDQSGSMTWNDANGVRFDFLKNFIADIDTKLGDYSPDSVVSYSILKFRGRRIGNLTIGLQGTVVEGFEFDGVRVYRSTEAYPSTPSGYLAYDGLPQSFYDENLTPGTKYYYTAFAYGNFSTGQTPLYSNGMIDYGQPTTPPNAPVGVAGLTATEIITDHNGNVLPSGDTDFGYRKVSLTWLNPSVDPLFTANATNYSSIVLVRRDDRPPESPDDGTILLSSNDPTANISFIDDFDHTYEFANGLTYYYRIFTVAMSDVKCAPANAATASVAISVPARPWELLAPPNNVAPVEFDVVPGIPTYVIAIGNATIGLNWTAGAGTSDTVRYGLYYNETSFPLPTNEDGTSYTGTLLYSGTGAELDAGYNFIHRFLENAQPCFYVLVAYDILGNASSVQLTSEGVAPQPSATATTNFPPPAVSNFSVQVIDDETNFVSWTNPSAPQQGVDVPAAFWFDDVIGVNSSLTFMDEGTYDTSILNLTYQFVVDGTNIVYQPSNLTTTTSTASDVSVDGETVYNTVTTSTPIVAVDPSTFILLANTPSTGVNTITASASITSLPNLRNLVSSASISLHAALIVQNMSTGEVVAEVYTDSVSITWNNPFAIRIESSQTVNSPASWGPTGQDPETGCTTYGYDGGQSTNPVPGIYALSDKPFQATVEITYEGQAVTSPVPVTITLTDASTGLPTSLVLMPGSTQNTLITQTQVVSGEGLDRSGQPTGVAENRSLVYVDLPPSSIPGDLVLSATGSYNGYQQSASLTVDYAPCLNVDLNLSAFQPDGVDSAEQSAFVYFLVNGTQVPAPDFTVTSWTISPTCSNAPIIPLTSQDDVPGVGVNAYTRGGLATKIFWGPHPWPQNMTTSQMQYQVSVTVQANGMSATGHGILTLSPPVSKSYDRIFLRSITDGIGTPSIYADGIDSSTFEVVAEPENDNTGGTSSGAFFRNAVVNQGGVVPDLTDGQKVTMTAQVVDNTGAIVGGSGGTLLSETVAKTLTIKTNLSPNGVIGSAVAQVENGSALFTVSCDAVVPAVSPDQQESMLSAETALTPNIFYGTSFQAPQSGIYVVLTVYISMEINGQAVLFTGGGSDIINSSPPMFLSLMEPLSIS